MPADRDDLEVVRRIGDQTDAPILPGDRRVAGGRSEWLGKTNLT